MQNKQKYFIVSEHSFPRQWIMHTLDDVSRHSKDAFEQLTFGWMWVVIKVTPFQVIGFPEYNIGKKELSTQNAFFFFLMSLILFINLDSN